VAATASTRRVDVELSHDVLDVRTHRLRREDERVGDLIGRVAGLEEIDDLPFARGQRALDRTQARGAVGRRAVAIDEPACHVPRDRRFAATHSLERAGHGVDVRLLGEKPDRSCLEREQPEVVVAAAGEHDDKLVGVGLEELACREDAVELRHDDVHDHDVGPVVHGELNCFTAVLGLADDGQPSGLQSALDHRSGEGVVIRDDHAQRRFRCHPCSPLSPFVAPAALNPSAAFLWIRRGIGIRLKRPDDLWTDVVHAHQAHSRR
jgi:hypothetical protein